MGFIEDDKKCMVIKNLNMEKHQQLMKKYSNPNDQKGHEYKNFIKTLYCKQTALKHIIDHLESLKIPNDNRREIDSDLRVVLRSLDEINENLKKISIKI
jgi:hypothetical protein